ncbi:MAG: 3-hydroxyacyl-ACP dehydratase FabZ family protein [Planctomycetota bacterium]|nr:3-hydroxyacyl-ACP dehydratase FabZ family protein [Planctomycetota bacterium]
MWIDRVLELIPGQRLVAIKNVSLAEEHLHDHFPARGPLPASPVMPAALIVEGMAQSAGLLVGHAGAFREKVVLAKVSSVELSRDARPGDTLRYTATVERLDPTGASTKGLVELISHTASGPAPAVEIGRIDLMFSHLDRNMAGAQFPEHNFVFGEAFRTLLTSSGIAHGAAPA